MPLFTHTIFVVRIEMLHERCTSNTEQADEKLRNEFNRRFRCIREIELEKQQRVERLGEIGVFNADIAKMAATYGAASATGRAYLGTLSPPSD